MLPGSQNSFRFMERIKALYYARILNILDEALSKYCREDEQIFVDSIEIDIGKISFSGFDDYFLENLSQTVNEQIKEKIEFLRLKNMFNKNESNQERIMAEPERITEKIITTQEFKLEVLKYFLENSVLPWWSSDTSVNLDKYILELSIEEPGRFSNFISDILESNIIVQRIVKQFKRESINKMIETVVPDIFYQLDSFITELSDAIKNIDSFNQIHQNLEKVFYTTLLQLIGKKLSGENLIDEFLYEVIVLVGSSASVSPRIAVETLLNNAGNDQNKFNFTNDLLEKLLQINLHNDMKKFQRHQPKYSIRRSGSGLQLNEIDKSKLTEPEKIYTTKTPSVKINELPDNINETTKITESEKDLNRIFINNAGLVLLNPYLPGFFKNMGLLNEKGFINIHSQIKAVHLLQYIITGSEENPEYLLALNKILCGLDVSFPVERAVVITQKDKSGIKDLINSVVKNWTTLKNTSSEGFIGSFLNREGIMEIDQCEAVLRVERKTYDVILSSLPWSISRIKLSWMKLILNVEW